LTAAVQAVSFGLSFLLLFAASTGAADRLHLTGVVDGPTGIGVAGARVQIVRATGSAAAETVTGTDGRYGFIDAEPGSFSLQVSAPGFEEKHVSVVLQKTGALPPLRLQIAPQLAEITVTANLGMVEESSASARSTATVEHERIVSVPLATAAHALESVPGV
jgi:hypothetical protein